MSIAPEIFEEIRCLLFDKAQAGEHVYAVLDGASIPDLLDRLVSDNPVNVCLYRGELEADLAEVAPYLVQLEPGSEFAEWIVTEGWGRHWGIFARIAAELDDTRRHFRRFLIVHDPDNDPMYFRYYDPRVLRVFLPTCNSTELNEIFGTVAAYFMEAEDPAQCAEFSRKSGELVTQPHLLAAPAGMPGKRS